MPAKLEDVLSAVQEGHTNILNTTDVQHGTILMLTLSAISGTENLVKGVSAAVDDLQRDAPATVG